MAGMDYNKFSTGNEPAEISNSGEERRESDPGEFSCALLARKKRVCAALFAG